VAHKHVINESGGIRIYTFWHEHSCQELKNRNEITFLRGFGDGEYGWYLVPGEYDGDYFIHGGVGRIVTECPYCDEKMDMKIIEEMKRG